MIEKEIIGGAAVALGLYSYAVYLWQIHRRTIKPHLFTWLIWGTLMSIGFAAQYVEKAGPGIWNTGMSAAITLLVAVLAYFYGEKHITRGDWIAFFVALSAIPVWLMTNDPLWAVVIISVIDIAAFYPTFRKSWGKPHEEGAWSFFVGAMQFALSIFALQNITLTTALYPAVIAVMNTLLVLTLLYRRRVLA